MFGVAFSLIFVQLDFTFSCGTCLIVVVVRCYVFVTNNYVVREFKCFDFKSVMQLCFIAGSDKCTKSTEEACIARV